MVGLILMEDQLLLQMVTERLHLLSVLLHLQTWNISLVVDGVQENLITAPHPDMDGDGYGDMWDCATVTDYWSMQTEWSVGSGNNFQLLTGTCGSCSDVYGCMDVTACFDSTANVMDYSIWRLP